jgi:hypothetical protein
MDKSRVEEEQEEEIEKRNNETVYSFVRVKLLYNYEIGNQRIV